MLKSDAHVDWRSVVAFIAICFSITWAFEIGIVWRVVPSFEQMSVTALARDPQPGLILAAVLAPVMLIPAIAAFVVRRWIERRGFADAGLRWGRSRYYVWAFLIPIALSLVATGLTVVLGLGQWQGVPSELASQLGELPPALRTAPGLMLLSLVNVPLGLPIASIFTFGEEFGWRGFLQMRLRPMGVLPAYGLTGAIWGLWHAPLILKGYNYPDQPAFGVLWMIVFCVLLGIIFGWLRDASGSVFVPSVAHASLNSIAVLPRIFLGPLNSATGWLLGAVGWGVMLAFIVVLTMRGAFRAARQ